MYLAKDVNVVRFIKSHNHTINSHFSRKESKKERKKKKLHATAFAINGNKSLLDA